MKSSLLYIRTPQVQNEVVHFSLEINRSTCTMYIGYLKFLKHMQEKEVKIAICYDF